MKEAQIFAPLFCNKYQQQPSSNLQARKPPKNEGKDKLI